MHLRWKIAQTAEVLWWKQYLRNKRWEDYLTWKQDYWNHFMHTHGIDVSTEETVLDAGSGPVGIFSVLPRNKVVVIEPLLKTYKKVFPKVRNETYPNVVFIEQPLEAASFQQTFDKVFCLNVINHVKQLEQCLVKLRQAIGDSGTLFLSVDAHNFRFFKWLFRSIPLDILHPHQLDKEDYMTKLQAAGLFLEKIFLIKKGFFFSYYLFIATGIKDNSQCG